MTAAAADMRARWIENDGTARPYRPSDAARLFKWVVFRRAEGEAELVAMPHGAGREYHADAMAALASTEGWCTASQAEAFRKREGGEFPEADVAVLGGGTRLDDGTVRNLSLRFGPVPEAEDRVTRAALGLTA